MLVYEDVLSGHIIEDPCYFCSIIVHIKCHVPRDHKKGSLKKYCKVVGRAHSTFN